MHKKIIEIIKLVFSKSSGENSSAEKSKDRYRRAGRTAITDMASRIVNIATALITVPVTLSYLGTDRYGLWMALTSFITFLNFTDMGFGIGIQNSLANCFGRDDKQSARYYISSGLFVMFLLFFVFVVVAFFLLPFIDFNKIVTVQSETAASELLPTVQAMFIAFGLGLPAGMIQRIYNAYQQGYWGNMQLTAGNILGLISIFVCIHFKLGLPAIAFVFMSARFIVMLGGSVVLFIKRPWLRPSLFAVRWDFTKQIFNIGLTAMWAELAAILIVSGPFLVIAHQISTAAVTPFSVTQRLVGVVTMLLTVVVIPLWPAYSEAATRGDWNWVNRTFKHTIKFYVVILLPAFLFLTLLGQWVIRLWTGKLEAVPDWSLLMACNVWMLFRGWNTICCVLLNGLNQMIGQAIYGMFFGIVGLTAGYFVAANQVVSSTIWIVIIVGEILRCTCLSIEVGWLLKKQKSYKVCVAQ